MSARGRHFRVWCKAISPVTVGGSFCDFDGYRRTPSLKPCPRCGGEVHSVDITAPKGEKETK